MGLYGDQKWAGPASPALLIGPGQAQSSRTRLIGHVRWARSPRFTWTGPVQVGQVGARWANPPIVQRIRVAS